MDQQQERRSGDRRLDAIEASQCELKAGHAEMRERMNENTAMIKEIKQNTSEIIEFFNSAKGGIKFAALVGNTLKWVAGVATVMITLYMAVRSALGGGGN